MSDTNILKYLYDHDDIEKLIVLTKQSEDPLYQLYHLRALRKIGEFNIALSYISEHQMELYNAFGPELIKLHIDTLIAIDELDQALNVLKQYESFPYFSLETNEVIASLGEDVQTKRKKRQKDQVYDLKALDLYLASTNESYPLTALRYIGKNYTDVYSALLLKHLIEAPLEITRSLILLLLVEHKYNAPVKILKFGQTSKVVPAKLKEPIATKSFKELENAVINHINNDDDLNLDNIIRNVFLNHTLYIYPRQIVKPDRELVSYLYLFIALNMMGRTITLAHFALDYKISFDALVALSEMYQFTTFPLYQISE